MKLVYISSPYRGDEEENSLKALVYCRWASHQKVIPLAPHVIFTQFLDDEEENEREYGITLGLHLLSKCDELWVMGNKMSKGMEEEIREALIRGIPVKMVSDSQVYL